MGFHFVVAIKTRIHFDCRYQDMMSQIVLQNLSNLVKQPVLSHLATKLIDADSAEGLGVYCYMLFV